MWVINRRKQSGSDVEEAFRHRSLDELPVRWIENKVYGSEEVDRPVEEHFGIGMIASHRRNRAHATQDGILPTYANA